MNDSPLPKSMPSNFPAPQNAPSASLNDADVILPDLLDNKEFRNFLLYERTVRSGPLPDRETLQGLVDIYPDAAKIIFSDYHEQSAHRRELERLSITTGATLALRGQLIGGTLGGVGLIRSFIVASLGHEWAASVIGTASLVSLVSVFVVGRDQQKKERIEKAAVQEMIKQGDPVEDIESSKLPNKPRSKQSKNPSKPNKGKPS